MNETTATQRIANVSTDKLIENFENATIDCLMIPKHWLPESYQGKRSHVKLRSLLNEAKRRNKTMFKPDREVSVKFDEKRNIISARPGRLAILEKYKKAVDNETEIEYDENEDKLYDHQLTWVAAMVRGGLIEIDELVED